MKRLAPPIVLWLMFGGALAWITSRVADWFVMTDELLYERLALSIDRLHSPLPRVHDVAIANLNQLYPLVLAPVFATGTVADGLHRAHVLNAFVITSAAIPAYLLALRVTRNVWASALAAALTVAVPWLVLASFLLTEHGGVPRIHLGAARLLRDDHVSVETTRCARRARARRGGYRAHTVHRARTRARADGRETVARTSRAGRRLRRRSFDRSRHARGGPQPPRHVQLDDEREPACRPRSCPRSSRTWRRWRSGSASCRSSWAARGCSGAIRLHSWRC